MLKKDIFSLSRIIAFCLALILVLTVFASCAVETDKPVQPTETTESDQDTDNTQSGESGSGSESESEKEQESLITEGLKIDASFKIYRSNSELIGTRAANYIKAMAQALFGVELELSTDKLASGESIDPNEHVILIGLTNRPASQSEMEGLKSDDYMYSVPDDHTIVLGGYTAENLLSAAKAFCEAAFGYTESTPGLPHAVPVGTKQVVENGNYPVKSLKLNGIDVADLKILYNADDSEASKAATKITKIISAWTGYIVPVVPAENDTTTKAIRLVGNIIDFSYRIEKKEGSVYISAPSGSLVQACTKFVNLYLNATTKETMNIKINDQPTVVSSYSSTEFSGLTLVSRTDKEVREGITYVELKYKNSDNAPVVAHALIVRRGYGEFFLGTPDALPEQDYLQAPLAQALAVEEKFQDVDVIACVNGDQFAQGSSCYALGPTYQNGVKLSDQSGLTPHCFAMMMDGTYYCGNPNSIKDKTKIWSMVGANGMILEKGKVVQNGTADWFTTRHPRTALGYDDEGTFYVLEVDGRQTSVSNGATFIDMALMFMTLGATNAVNVDGGGSSIMYVENQNQELACVSSPSGGSPRWVINTILVVVHKDT